MHSLKSVAALAAFFAFVWTHGALAAPVTLSSKESENTTTGELLYFDGDLYRIETKYGVLTLNADSVTCSGAGCPDQNSLDHTVHISGLEGLNKVLMPALMQAFAQRNGYRVRRAPDPDGGAQFEFIGAGDQPVGTLILHPMTTTDAFGALLDGQSDIVLARREMTEAERKAAFARHVGDFLQPTRSAVFALDALVPMVSLNNPLRTVSLPDLSAVLTGQMTQWSDLDGPDEPISIVLPAKGSGLRQTLDRAFALDETNASTVPEEPRTTLTLAPFSERGLKQPLSLRGNCGFDMKATRRSIKTGDYPLTMPVYLYTPARRLPPLARSFIAFAKSVTAQTVIRRSGLVDQLPEEIPIDEQGLRMLNAIRVIEPDQGVSVARRMVGVLEGKSRLSLSFRFEEGSQKLNGQSRSNLQLLARAIEAGRFAERQLVFVGFSDGVGSGNANLAIAQKRADQVRATVALVADRNSLKRVEMLSESFGEAMPMACDDSDLGRHVNRRVEVWVR